MSTRSMRFSWDAMIIALILFILAVPFIEISVACPVDSTSEPVTTDTSPCVTTDISTAASYLFHGYDATGVRVSYMTIGVIVAIIVALGVSQIFGRDE